MTTNPTPFRPHLVLAHIYFYVDSAAPRQAAWQPFPSAAALQITVIQNIADSAPPSVQRKKKG